MREKFVKIATGFFILLLFSNNLFAGVGVRILTSTDQGSKFTRVDLETMQTFASTVKAIDPNFQKDGLAEFTGITLKRLLSISNISFDNGVTVICADQYIGYIPFQILFKDQALLAWHLNGNRISRLKGGPLKIIYPDEAQIHGSCYVWYVDTIIAGELTRPSFQLTYQGNTRKLRIDDISSGVERLDEKLFSMPLGCRNGLETKKTGRVINVITLKKLIDLEIGKEVNQVTFIPFAGASIRINKAALSFPVYITLSFDGKPIHPALGGPFSVIFPIEQYRALAGIVPESGALFFLNQIILE